MIVTDDIARRLEAAEASDARACAEAATLLAPDSQAVVQEFAGGVLTFCGPTSPLTHTIGLGMQGPVTEQDIETVEHFFVSRGAAVAIDVCPHADPILREILEKRGYRISEMNNVLVRAISPALASEDIGSIRVDKASDDHLYSRTVMAGFFGREQITDEEFRLGQILFHMPCSTPLLAYVDGEVAGGCGLSIRNGVASLYGDAVLPAFRGRGVHRAMIDERLRRAAAAGCDLAAAGTVPGSTSHRNYARLGFEVAYTKITMVFG